MIQMVMETIVRKIRITKITIIKIKTSLKRSLHRIKYQIKKH